jgi:hypothetical protein
LTKEYDIINVSNEREVKNMEEIIKLRIGFLKEFDYYIRNVIKKDHIVTYWDSFGVPSDCTENMFDYYASITPVWVDIVNTFKACLTFAAQEEEKEK